MKEDLETIIKKLERAQDMMYSKNYSNAHALICEAQSVARFAKDNKAN